MLFPACGPHCDQCTTQGPGKCDTGQCVSNYFIVHSKQTCARCADHCYNCTVNGGEKCDDGRCEPKYAIDNSTQTCVECSPNCYDCTNAGPGKCDESQCFPKYGINSNSQSCEACDAHCNSCTNNGAGKCDNGHCFDRYGFDPHNTICKECGAHCDSCTTNGAGKCDEGSCRTGYVYHSSNQVCVEYECKMCGATSSFSPTLYRLGLVAVGHDNKTNCLAGGDTNITVYCSDHCWVRTRGSEIDNVMVSHRQVFRQEKDGQVVFMRGCFKSTVCDKYTYQNCHARKIKDTTTKTMTCFKCCSGDCATYVPGINAATLASWGVLTSFLVLAVVATTSQ
ncbi:hypothetical protein LSAT2_025072 [Lamellibrachia satsuma]|nr:hypothetical protein LSAT2_025072 [Lamellibrachia satsuma]